MYKITALALGAEVRKIEDKSYPDGHDETTIKFLKAAIHSCQWRWMMEPISQMLCFSSLRQGKSLSLRLEEVNSNYPALVPLSFKGSNIKIEQKNENTYI